MNGYSIFITYLLLLLLQQQYLPTTYLSAAELFLPKKSDETGPLLLVLLPYLTNTFSFVKKIAACAQIAFADTRPAVTIA